MSATLRALAGLPVEPVPLAESALIMIDCQNTYTHGPMELVGVQAALDQAAELLDRAHDRPRLRVADLRRGAREAVPRGVHPDDPALRVGDDHPALVEDVAQHRQHSRERIDPHRPSIGSADQPRQLRTSARDGIAFPHLPGRIG